MVDSKSPEYLKFPHAVRLARDYGEGEVIQASENPDLIEMMMRGDSLGEGPLVTPATKQEYDAYITPVEVPEPPREESSEETEVKKGKFTCSVCGREFPTEEGMNTHFDNIHSEES